MKTVSRKCGVYTVLSAVLLVFALLILNCTEPVENIGLPGVETSAVGKTGFLKISIANIDTRSTVLPTLEGTTSYGIQLTGTGPSAGTIIAIQELDVSAAAGSIEVLPGTYTVTTIAFKEAYTDGTNTDKPIAMGAATGVVVSAAGTATSITLREYTGEGSGTFAYILTTALSGLNFGSGDTATMDLVALGGSAVTQTQINLNGNTTGSDISLPSGFYNVVISITKPNHFPFKSNRVLHIYRNLNSALLDEGAAFQLKPNEYVIGYDALAGSGAPASATIVHGNTITKPANPTKPTGNFTFDGWWTKDGTGSDYGILWRFTGDSTPLKVLRARTLYAKWDSFDPVNIEVTLTPFAIPGQVPVGSSDTIILSSDDIADSNASSTPIEKNISIDNATGLSNFVWKIVELGYEFSSETTSSITIDFADDALITAGIGSPGTYTLNVQAQSGDGTVEDPYRYWSGNVTITIN